MSSNMYTWIHCNNCYRYYSREVQFYMLNCSHILCPGCLKKIVIGNGNECKYCKRPVKYRKICKEMDPKLRDTFDLQQHAKIQAVGQSVKVAQLQFKHLANKTVIKRTIKKIAEMKKLDQKLESKNQAMVKHIEKILRGIGGSSQGPFIGTSNIRKEPLLLMSRASSNRSDDSFLGRQAPSGHSSSMFSSGSGRTGSSGEGFVMKRHPQITRLSKLSAQCAELYK